MPIIRKVFKLADSKAVTIPPPILKHLKIGRGDYVVWTAGSKSIAKLEKLTPRKHPGFFSVGPGIINYDEKQK